MSIRTGFRYLRAACAQARKSEPYGGEFAGRWALQELEHESGHVSSLAHLS